MLSLRLGAPCPHQILCLYNLALRPDTFKSIICLLACITTEILQKSQVQTLTTCSLLSFYFNCYCYTKNRGAFYSSPLSSPSTKKLAWELISKIESIPWSSVGGRLFLPNSKRSFAESIFEVILAKEIPAPNVKEMENKYHILKVNLYLSFKEYLAQYFRVPLIK